MALSELSNDRSADSDCFEAGTLLSYLNSAATSSDVGQTTDPSMPADARGVAGKNMALEILRRQAQSSAPGSIEQLVFETMKDVIASFNTFPSDESLGIICAALPCLVAIAQVVRNRQPA